MTSSRPQVRAIEPAHAVPGGRVLIQGQGFDPARAHAHRVFFGDVRAQVTRVSHDSISVVVPDGAMPEVRVELGDGRSDAIAVSIATVLADQLQPVANPVFDHSGNLYVTLSGSRGEKVPVSIFRIDEDGDSEPFVSDVLNPTGLAWGPDDRLYVSSREEGVVYRVNGDGDVEIYADELGTATGLAFDAEGILYVGDRRGTVFRVEPNGEPRSFCQLEPSVSAYHFAFDGMGRLFVTGPSLASVDVVYCIERNGESSVFYSGFGRPQGMAFDVEGNLYVTEGLVGDSGVYRIDRHATAERVITAPPLVGLAFDPEGGLVLAGSSSVYHLDIGIDGQPLF